MNDRVIDWLDIIYELRSKLIERLMDGWNDWVINYLIDWMNEVVMSIMRNWIVKIYISIFIFFSLGFFVLLLRVNI